MQEQNLIRDLLARKDLERLRLVPGHEIGAYLVVAFEEEERADELVNFDRLMSNGILLAKTRHEEVDRRALDWLLSNPTDKRLDMIAAFLNGIWNRPYRAHPVPPENVRLLIRARDKLSAASEDAEYSYIQALCQVMRADAEPALKNELRPILRALQERAFTPPLDQLAKSVIEQALAKS